MLPLQRVQIQDASAFLFVHPSQLPPQTLTQVYVPDWDVVAQTQGQSVPPQKYQSHLPLRFARYQEGQRSHRLLPVQLCLHQMGCYRSPDETELELRNHAQSISREKDEFPGYNARHSKQEGWGHCLQNDIQLDLLLFW